ncbi:helix-turn-helix transcriptional regulator [bacterium]|nr:helix-turn-helix transcriptional regulator [bacterium]
MCNAIIKEKMKDRGVRQWEIADYLGISESTMGRKMRSELDPDFKDQVSKAIDVIGSQRGACKINAGAPVVINK